jgi:hypothetical protein
MKKKIKTSFSDKNLNKNDKSLEIFTFLPSTNHSNYNTKKNKNDLGLKIQDMKKRFKETKLEPLNLLEKKIKKKIKLAVLKKKIKNESNNNLEIKNRNVINLKYIKKNKKNIKEKENEIKENKFPQLIQEQTKLSSISPRISFPYILNDPEILHEIFIKNFNYQKNILKERFKIKYLDKKIINKNLNNINFYNNQ